MEYHLRILNDTQEATVSIEDDSQLKITLNGQDYHVTGSVVSAHQLHLSVNGTGIDAFVAQESASCKTIILNGVPFRVEDADAPTATQRRAKRSAAQPEEVTPPMPAVVVSILVNENDPVTQGDGVIVVAAMKMETTLAAPFDGLVKKINVSEGDKVMPGDILVEIAKGETP